MKKAFLFLFAATVAAVMSFNSCTNPPVTPNGGGNTDKNPSDTTQVNDSTDTEKPGNNDDADYEGMSEQWIEVNKTIKAKWGTKTTIPEPKGEYEIIENRFVEKPAATWKNGCFEVSLTSLEAVKTYPDVLKDAGWQSTMNGGNEWWSDMTDYMSYVHYDEYSGMICKIYFYYRPDTGMQPGKW